MPKSKFLLIVGVSGVGKNSIIRELQKIDSRFAYIQPETTRPPRRTNDDKIFVTEAEYKKKEANGGYIFSNHVYGAYYGTPKDAIFDSFERELLPVLDFIIEPVDAVRKAVNNRLFVVYVTPPSLAVLKERLDKDNRDHDGSRLEVATKELEKYHNHEYDKKIDMHIVSHNDKTPQIAQAIYDAYVNSFS